MNDHRAINLDYLNWPRLLPYLREMIQDLEWSTERLKEEDYSTMQITETVSEQQQNEADQN